MTGVPTSISRANVLVFESDRIRIQREDGIDHEITVVIDDVSTCDAGRGRFEDRR